METKDKNMISKNEAAVEEDNKETPIKEGDQKKDRIKLRKKERKKLCYFHWWWGFLFVSYWESIF